MTPFKTITSEPPSVTEFLSPVGMFARLWGQRELIGQFAWREVVGRYKGAYLGLAWSLLNPLMTLAVYSFVFGMILKARFATGSDAGRLDFVLNLFCGLIVYGVFSNCLGRCAGVIIENRNFVKRVVFPLEALPVAILGGSLVNAAMGLAILLPVLAIFAPQLSSTMYLFPLVLAPLCALTLGLSWFLASLGVFLRDIGQVVIVGLQLLFFASPIIYPLSAAPDNWQLLMRLNPLTTILEDSRRTLISGQSPEWGWWLAVTVLSIVVLQLGYVWFMKSKRVFADLV